MTQWLRCTNSLRRRGGSSWIHHQRSLPPYVLWSARCSANFAAKSGAADAAASASFFGLVFFLPMADREKGASSFSSGSPLLEQVEDFLGPPPKGPSCAG